MKRINCILIFLLLLLGGGVHAQTDSIISVSGEVGDFDSGLDFLNEAGGTTRFPRLTDAGELLYYAPIVSTDSVPVASVGSSTATVYGNILFNGWCESVLEQGFQISTTSDFFSATTVQVTPTNSYTDCNLPCSENVFTYSFTGLTAGTTYHVRTYATNSTGTTYGAERSFTTFALPTVTTNTVSSITTSTASCGGNVTADGGTSVTARGVCWSTSHNPTTNNNKTTNGTGMGSFTSSITGLISGTTYYVRAYATNSVGTAYGNEVTFTTTPADGASCGVCQDYDGNTYNTVQIGNQCWMKENLRTTKYSNGISISQGSTTSTTVAYWYYPNNSSSNKATYGLLYNWKAVMRSSSSSSANPSGVQGICPTGWHVPSSAEWVQLLNYVKSRSEYCCERSNEGATYPIAKALSAKSGWTSTSETCYPGYMQSNNNATGFSAVPAGNYSGEFGYFPCHAEHWSATQVNSSKVYTYNIACGYHGVFIREWDKSGGYSVRCVRD